MQVLPDSAIGALDGWVEGRGEIRSNADRLDGLFVLDVFEDVKNLREASSHPPQLSIM